MQDEHWRYQGGPAATVTPGTWQLVQAAVSTELAQGARAFGVQFEVVGGHGEVAVHVDTFTQGRSATPTPTITTAPPPTHTVPAPIIPAPPTPTPRAVAPLTLSTPGQTEPGTRRTWSTTLSAAGGSAPCTWQVTGLPRGMTASPGDDGTLAVSGTLTRTGGPYQVSVTVTDARGTSASTVLDLDVRRPSTTTSGPRAHPVHVSRCGSTPRWSSAVG